MNHKHRHLLGIALLGGTPALAALMADPRNSVEYLPREPEPIPPPVETLVSKPPARSNGVGKSNLSGGIQNHPAHNRKRPRR